MHKVTHSIAFSLQLPSHAVDCKPQNSLPIFFKDLFACKDLV